jgi:hypothetical protein
MSQNPKHARIFVAGTMAVISHNALFWTMLMVKLTHLGREFSSSTNLTFASWRVGLMLEKYGAIVGFQVSWP